MESVGKFDLYSTTLKKHVQEGQILVALRDSSLNDFVHTIVPGPLYSGLTSNFVYPVLTSISGNKSDRYVSRKFSLATSVKENCTVSNTFSVESKHDFRVEEREKIRRLLYSYGIDPKNHEHELFVQ